MHQTKFNTALSSIQTISAGVVQGSALGPALFLVCVSDLHTCTPGNFFNKYTNDCILVVSAYNTNSCSSELSRIEQWASRNNLRLNIDKSKELIVWAKRTISQTDPPLVANVAKVSSLVLLEVTIIDTLSMSDHVNKKILSCSRSLHALKTLKAHGLPSAELQEVFRITVLNSLLYASPAS